MKFPATTTKARITEVFSSLQGEGTHVGERHLFVRFEECHMHCTYCDELDKVGVETSLEQLKEQILTLEKNEGPHAYVSLTGGEPLIYLPYIKPLMQWLNEYGFKTYLETSGIVWKALEEVIELCDCISMDLKPASVTGEKAYLDEHQKFLSIAKKTEVFTKMVVSKEIDLKEFDQHVEIVRAVSTEIPFVLMPITTNIEGHEDEDLMKLLEHLQRIAAKYLNDVRIVPRFHKILNIR